MAVDGLAGIVAQTLVWRSACGCCSYGVVNKKASRHREALEDSGRPELLRLLHEGAALLGMEHVIRRLFHLLDLNVVERDRAVV